MLHYAYNFEIIFFFLQFHWTCNMNVFMVANEAKTNMENGVEIAAGVYRKKATLIKMSVSLLWTCKFFEIFFFCFMLVDRIKNTRE